MKVTISFTGHPRIDIPVSSLLEASKCFAAHRDGFGFGASAMRTGCGDVRQGRALIGRISYNGRIWTPDGKPVDGLEGVEHIQQAK